MIYIVFRRWIKNADQRAAYPTSTADGMPYDTARCSRLLVTTGRNNKTPITSCVPENRRVHRNYYPTPRSIGVKPPVPAPPSIPPPPLPNNVPYNCGDAETDYYDDAYTDHVYQSPNFERRPLPGENAESHDTIGAQYFELEPEDDKPLTSSNPTPRHLPYYNDSNAPLEQPHSDMNGVIWRNTNNNHGGAQKHTPLIVNGGQRCSFPGTPPPRATRNPLNSHAGGAMTS